MSQMNRRLSPREKKELEYDQERRFHHNNDKSARKWIPARKARLSRGLRRGSKQILVAAVLESTVETESLDDQVSNAQLRTLVPRQMFSKDRNETLREHVQHQMKDRKNPTRPGTPYHIPSREQHFMQPYVRERDRHSFMSYMRLCLRSSKKVKESTRRFAREVKSCIDRDTPFFAGFFEDEPSWRPRLLKWAERVLRGDLPTGEILISRPD